VTLLELTEAFGVFANLGMRVEPRFITKITDVRGELVEEGPILRRPAISPDTAYVMTSMLRNVIEHGTGTRAAIDRPAAGKTGTTNDQHDVWFIGYTPQLLTGVWVGYDHDKSLIGKETGGKVAAPIWHDFMSKALADQPVLDFAVPNEVTLVAVDSNSGQRVTPGSAGSVFQAFKRGTEPGFPAAQPAAPASDGVEPEPEESVVGAASPPAGIHSAALHADSSATSDGGGTATAHAEPVRHSAYALPGGAIDGMARRRAEAAAAAQSGLSDDARRIPTSTVPRSDALY
jgi:membrane carboxypeptidase/penicillin-binding protein